MRNVIRNILEENELLKGNTCRTLGDCIISLEALETTGKMVCTTNIKDFKPICDTIGVKICDLEEEFE